MRLHATAFRRAAIILGILVAVVVFWRVTGLHELAVEFVDFLERVARRSGTGGKLAFLTLCALASSIGPFTVVPLVPSAARVWGVGSTGLLMLLGGLIGAGLTYLIGRYAGERVLHLFIRPSRVARWKETVPEDAAFVAAVAIKFALPAEIGYVFGMLRFGLLKYLLATCIAYVPIVAAILWGSEAFLKGRLGPLAASIAAIVLLNMVAALYLRRFNGTNRILRRVRDRFARWFRRKG